MQSTSFYPSQIAYNPTGAVGSVQISSVIFGRDITGNYEGIGFGQGGRPDYLQLLQINLTERESNGDLNKIGSITINVGDLLNITDLPSSLNITLREIDVCDNGTAKRAVILMSEPFI